MIQAYPARASVAPGEPLVLHVATDAARFHVRVHRWSDGLTPMSESPPLRGEWAPPGNAADDWGWPAYRIEVPDTWPSGVYLAELVEAGAAHRSMPPSLGGARTALFVVRGGAASRARLLYKLPMATYHAYNCTGGGCFYVKPPRSLDPPGSRVTLRRPGGGTGGEVHGAVDHYDDVSMRQTFAHWDAPFIRWLRRNGYDPEFCTDLDVHEDAGLCDRYAVLLSVGHDEYWSEATRDHVEAFVGRGGHVAFFGANTCWWRIHYVDDATAIVCHQGGPDGALDHWWPATGANRPEDSLTGVSYRHGGGWWDGPRSTRGYVVQDGDHWVFAGTGLQRGETFGRDTTPPIVGYECDGAPLDSVDASGLAVLSARARASGTPAGFRVLGVGLLDGRWDELPPRETHAAGAGIHAATLGAFSRNGTVFTAGTTDWARVLGTGQDERVDRITRNVLDRLLGASPA